MAFTDWIDPRKLGGQLGSGLGGLVQTPGQIPIMGPWFQEGEEKYQAHMGNPQMKPVADLPPPPPSPGYEALLKSLGTGAAPPPDPFAGYTPEQLATGSTGSFSKARQTTSGIKPMPGYVEGLEKAQARQEAALKQGAEAEAEKARLSALAQDWYQTAFKANVLKHEAKRRELEAKIAEQETKAEALRAEVASAQPDPDRWWSSRSGSQKAALGIAAALQGFIQGFYGQAGPNAVVAATQKLIDRDIALQSRAIQRKEKLAQMEYGIVGDLYKRLGDLRLAEDHARVMLKESLTTKLDELKSLAASPMIKAQAEMASAKLGISILHDKQKIHEKAQEKVTTTESRGGTTTRAPLFSVLRAMQAAKAKGGKLEKMPKEQMTKLIAARDANAREQRYIQQLRKYQGESGILGRAAKRGLQEVPATEAQALKGQRGEILSLHVKAMSGVTARPDEIARLDPLYPSMTDSPDLVLKKHLGRLKERQQALISTVQTYPGAREARGFVGEIMKMQKQIDAVNLMLRGSK